MSRSERRAVESELLRWMREDDAAPDEARFEALALRLFRFQAIACPPYAAYLARLRVEPDQVASWREIPAVPTGAFKELELCCFPPERAVRVFRTSGTSTDRPGRLLLDTLAIYDHSLRPSFRRGLLPDLGAGDRLPIRVLAPTPEESRDSSLSYMFGAAVGEWGNEQSGFDVVDGVLRTEALNEWGAALREPALVCGTAFAFVHWLDALARDGVRLALPAGSRLMETGGFKGRSRSVPRAELYAALETRLGIPSQRMVNQYGMTELGSQFYDSVLSEAGPRRKLEAPWARVRIVDPDSGDEVPEGQVGVVEIVDLANTGSVLALRTSDLGRRVAVPNGCSGFDVLGRAEGAEVRGCSVAADAMLA